MDISKTIFFFFLLLLFVLYGMVVRTTADVGAAPEINVDTTAGESFAEASSLRRLLMTGRHRPRGRMTCDKFPQVCHHGGSPGRSCCKKRCVDLLWDKQNCGGCGRKCRYGETCCRGKCLNVLFDRSNCGGCHRRCKKGSRCKYGMCSYA